MGITIEPLCEVIGAKVTGVDLGQPLDETVFNAVRAAWLTYHLLVFPNVQMTPAHQIAFTRRLGPLHTMPLAEYNMPEHPEIFVVSNVKKDGAYVGMRNVGRGWHTDGEDKPIPNAGSLLYARIVPPEGGDTLFANLHAVYDALPTSLKQRIEGRRACFSQERLHHVHYPHLPALTPAQQAAWPDVYHPLVRTHPDTGRRSLYVGRWACAIEDLPDSEGRELIAELQTFATQPQFVYRHTWRARDALLWDNRCMLHCALGFDDTRYERHMLRTTLEGDLPYFDSGKGVIRSSLTAA